MNAQIDADTAARNVLVQKLADINAELAGLVNDLAAAKADCDKIRISLEQTRATLQQRQNEYNTIQARIVQARADLSNKSAEVQRLAALLEAAKVAEADARIVLQNVIA